MSNISRDYTGVKIPLPSDDKAGLSALHHAHHHGKVERDSLGSLDTFPTLGSLGNISATSVASRPILSKPNPNASNESPERFTDVGGPKFFSSIVNPPLTESEEKGETFYNTVSNKLSKLPEDERISMQYGIVHDDKASPEMKSKTASIKETVLKETGMHTVPKLNSFSIDDEVSFKLKQFNEESINKLPLSDSEKNSVRFFVYHPEAATSLTPEEKTKFSSAIAHGKEIATKGESTIREKFKLPSDWQSNGNMPKLMSSTFDKTMFGTAGFHMQSEILENHSGSFAHMRALMNAVANPTDPTVDPDLKAKATEIRSKVLDKVKSELSLPGSFAPDLSKVNTATFGSTFALSLNKSVDSATKDAATISKTISQLPPNALSASLPELLQEVVQALSLCKQKLVEMQAEDSKLATEFSNANSLARQQQSKLGLALQQKEQASQAKAAKKAHMMKILGPCMMVLLLPLMALGGFMFAAAAAAFFIADAATVTAVAIAVTTVQVSVSLAMEVDSQVNGQHSVFTNKMVDPMMKGFQAVTLKMAGLLHSKDAKWNSFVDGIAKANADVAGLMVMIVLSGPTAFQVAATDPTANPVTDFLEGCGVSAKDANYAGMAFAMLASVVVMIATGGSAAAGVMGNIAKMSGEAAEEGAVTAEDTTTAVDTATTATGAGASTGTSAATTATTTAASSASQTGQTVSDTVQQIQKLLKGILKILNKLLSKFQDFSDAGDDVKAAQSGYDQAEAGVNQAKNAYEKTPNPTTLKNLQTAGDKMTTAKQTLESAQGRYQAASKAVQDATKSVRLYTQGANMIGQAVPQIAQGIIDINQAQVTKEIGAMQADLDKLTGFINMLQTEIDKFFNELGGQNSPFANATQMQNTIDHTLNDMNSVMTSLSGVRM